jgi:small subunit ribosomal protein S9
MAQEVYSATGRRKRSVARVVVKPGKGEFTVNGRNLQAYLTRETLANLASQALSIADIEGTVDVVCKANGGGISGQAGAIRLGLARAVLQMNENLREPLRNEGLLTRDPRQVERKKYGQPKARKRFQYSKR